MKTVIRGKALWVACCAAPAVLVLASVLTAAEPAATPGEAETPQVVYSAFNGKVTFKTFCSNCHGVGGKGDGYLLDMLRQKPADLTVLAKENGGVFPKERLTESIDGTTGVKGHGLREMPVWGDVFLWPENDEESKLKAKRKIGELVAFLETIQEGSAAAAP